MTATLERLPKGWETGRCRRDHDITDPANVRLIRRSERTGYECRPCIRARRRAARSGVQLPPAVTFPPRVCEQCGETYRRPGKLTSAAWAARRYCTDLCRRAAITKAAQERHADRQATGSSGRLTEQELSRLRRMVGVTAAPPGDMLCAHRRQP